MKMKSFMNLPKGELWVSEAGEYRCVGGLRELPYVEDKYECVLKENNIPYRKFEQPVKIAGVIIYNKFCEYWNPLLFEEELVSLPVYTRHIPDLNYRYYGTTFCEKAPTYETARLAKTLEKFIERKIKEYEDRKENSLKEACYNFAKSKLLGKTSRFCTSELLFNSDFDDIEMNGDHIRILKVSNFGSNQVAIFDMNRVNNLSQRGKDIFLFVPNNDIASRIIGKNHRNIHLWENELGVEKILVYSI